MDFTGQEDLGFGSERRSQKRSGMIRQPIRKGIRQPQTAIVSGGRIKLRATPRKAAIMTATCWLADCQAQ